MTPLRRLFLLLAAALLLAACTGRADLTRTLDDAQAALDGGNAAAARALASSLLADTARLQAADFGRLSIIFLRIADISDGETAPDVEHAVECCRQALAKDEAQAMDFYRNGPVEDDRYVMMLTTIVRNLETPDAIPEDDPSWLPADSADTLALYP